MNTRTKNPECESVRDFYLFALHFSLKQHLEFSKVISNGEKVFLQGKALLFLLYDSIMTARGECDENDT
jgi:hypothetical protein